jgi:hypothetical protein
LGTQPLLLRFALSQNRFLRYTQTMDEVIKFNPAAFKHGISEADIRWAANHPFYEDILEGYLNKYLVLVSDLLVLCKG